MNGGIKLGLVVSNVSKHFGAKTAVDNISFTLDTPGVFGLLGTNGAGKTTTIRMILGILEKDSGSITWNGSAVKRENVSFGYLPEERGLYPRTKVFDQLNYFASLRGLYGQSAKKAINYWLDRLEVKKYADMNAEQLSKGNQQKVQLVASILHDPDLIVLDEPMSGLDPINADLFKSVILELVEKGKYIVMSSHQMESVEQFCRDILILVDGKTVLNGNLHDIKSSYGRTNLYIGCEADITPQIRELGINLLSRTAHGYELRIQSENAAYTLLRNLLDSGTVIDKFEIREPTLHEIFVEKAGNRK
jgi:ABC-2 type transport system ATP-binding protein